MKKLIYSFLLKLSLSCGLAAFIMAVEAIQIGDRIELPIQILVYPDDGSNCKKERYGDGDTSYCTIGHNDTVEVLEIHNNKVLGAYNNTDFAPYVNKVVLKYFPGDNDWDDKCKPKSGQNLCFSSKQTLEKMQLYLASTPKIEVVRKHEEPWPDLLGDNNSTAIPKGQIFSTYTSWAKDLEFFDNPKEIIKSMFSGSYISYAIRWVTSGFDRCDVPYGSRLKVVGFKNPVLIYVRLMEPEYEEKVGSLDCPVGSLFSFHIWDLIVSNKRYEQSLQFREEFIKAVVASRLDDDLFNLPKTLDGLLVGQKIDTTFNQKVTSIQNIDFEYFMEWENDLEQYKHSLQKESEETGPFIEDSSYSMFTAMPMFNWWDCEQAAIRGLISGGKQGELHSGQIIGFTNSLSFAGSDIKPRGSHSSWFAIVENEIIGHPFPELLKCKFVLIPTSDLRNTAQDAVQNI